MQAGRLLNWRSALENPHAYARAMCIVAATLMAGLELWPTITAQFGSAVTTHPPAKAAAAHQVANIEQITAADLFGHAANQNANLPQTDLQITLRAVFAANDPKAASAVIETGDGAAQVVKIGGAIGSSATLQAVYPNRVVLQRNGVLETLYFPAPQEAAAMNIAQNSTAPTAANPADNNLPAGTTAEDIKRAAILQRLEELRARTPPR